MMRRRDFITLLGGVAASWPLAARAQQRPLPVVGFLVDSALNRMNDGIAAFREGLKESGFVEGQNVSVIYNSTNNDSGRLPGLAADLARRRVDVIVTINNAAALAAKAATTTIPIVFGVGDDPVDLGLVTSLNYPAGNLTGATVFFGELTSKRFELLHELVPRATTVSVLLNPANANSGSVSRDVQSGARSLGLHLRLLRASTKPDIDAAFAALVHPGEDALLVSQDPFIRSQSERIISLSARYSVPAIYPRPEYVAEGGLISYAAADQSDLYRKTGIYAGRILKGEKPGDLPILQPTKFKLIVNLKAAKAIGLTIPESFLTRADEIIE